MNPDPNLYHQSNGIQTRDATVCLEKYAPLLKWRNKTNRILDVGCGDGRVTNILKKYLPANYKLLGSDINEKMVSFAVHHNNDDQTSFTVLDIAGELWDGMQGSFDHVFSFYALNWVVDQRRAFENIFNALNQGGECFMIFVAQHTIYDAFYSLYKPQNSKWRNYMHDIHNYISPYNESEDPEKDVTNLMESIGFVNINVELKDMVFVFDTEEVLRKQMTAINPFKIPKEKCNDFIDDFMLALRDIAIKHNPSIFKSPKDDTPLYYTTLIVRGQKPLTDINAYKCHL